MLSAIPSAIQHRLRERLNTSLIDFNFTGGGCINHGGALTTSDGTYFLKWNDAAKFPNMFQAEAKGLSLLTKANAIRIPNVIDVNVCETHQYILIEFIASKSGNSAYWKHFGECLANLHKVSADTFGLDHDNYIGSLHQYNTPKDSWTEFFISQRLQKQLELALQKDLIEKKIVSNFETLYKMLPDLLPHEKPSLVHGDLWSGNLISDENGEPCLIDPALYFGHREADLAMTMLFGGIDQRFILTYNEVFPLTPGFSKRSQLYNLYPLLVHVNLFGKSYLSQVVSILNQYV